MRGVTLVELIVALVILGLLTSLTAAGFHGLRPPPTDPWRDAVARARVTAVRSGRSTVVEGSAGTRALLLPDGRAIGPGLDQLTGEAIDAAR